MTLGRVRAKEAPAAQHPATSSLIRRQRYSLLRHSTPVPLPASINCHLQTHHQLISRISFSPSEASTHPIMDHQDRLKPFTIRQLQPSNDLGPAPQSAAFRPIHGESSEVCQLPTHGTVTGEKQNGHPVISMRKKSYDEILGREPAAALRYVDDDDGDIIRVCWCHIVQHQVFHATGQHYLQARRR